MVVILLRAASLAHALKINTPTIAAALNKITTIPGRGERIEAGQDFTVVVDYAHTPDSLEALYSAYASKKKICVLGSTGGGRDLWKRPAMGKIADDRCDHVILTNEDPYNEDPKSIVESIARGMKRSPEIIMDRREAIARALALALSLSKGTQPLDAARGNQNSMAVLITGKGTDPTIQIANGKNIPWSDAQVVHEELSKLAQRKV